MFRFICVWAIFFEVFSTDLSQNYKEFSYNTSAIKSLKDVTVVLIPGILSETVIKDSSQPINLSFAMGDYFKNFMNFFDAHKIKNKLVLLESENGVLKNSEDLERKLTAIPGEIFVITHSKGSLEFLDVLIHDDKNLLKNRLRFWLSLQSPFYGSSLANVFNDTMIIRNFSSLVFDFLGGSKEGISSLTTKERKKYMTENKNEISAVFKNTKNLQFLTYMDNEKGVDSVLELSRNYLTKKSGKNDGMVEIKNALYKDSNHVIISHVDHLSTILNKKYLYQKWDLRKLIEFTLHFGK